MTPLCRLYPALLVQVGGNRTRPSGLHKPQATAELKQAIAELSPFTVLLGASEGEVISEFDSQIV